jgi:sortase A
VSTNRYHRFAGRLTTNTVTSRDLDYLWIYLGLRFERATRSGKVALDRIPRSARVWLQAPAALPEWNLPLPPRWQRALAWARGYVGVRTVLEMGLWAIAFAGLGTFVVSYSAATLHQYQQRRRLEALLTSAAPLRSQSTTNVNYSANSPRIPIDGLLGLMEIPRLEISAVYEEGVDDDTLAGGIGHVPGTPLPGEPGNAALAAHRDTYFHRLGEVQVGDVIHVKTRRGEHHYRVASTAIVKPGDVSVLDNTPVATLTLVTCYPFNYVGTAPQRFVVTATMQD